MDHVLSTVPSVDFGGERWSWKKFLIEQKVLCRKFVLVFDEQTTDPDGKYQLGQLKFWAVPYKGEQIVHEKLTDPINYNDGIRIIQESKEGRPVTKVELRDYLKRKGALYPEP